LPARTQRASCPRSQLPQTFCALTENQLRHDVLVVGGRDGAARQVGRVEEIRRVGQVAAPVLQRQGVATV